MTLTLRIAVGRHAGTRISVNAPEFLIGRDARCHLSLTSRVVSRQHAAIPVQEDGACVRDLGSTNGTLLNGERVTEGRKLHNGDHLQIGPLCMSVRLTPPASRDASADTGLLSEVADAAENPSDCEGK